MENVRFGYLPSFKEGPTILIAFSDSNASLVLSAFQGIIGGEKVHLNSAKGFEPLAGEEVTIVSADLPALIVTRKSSSVAVVAAISQAAAQSIVPKLTEIGGSHSSCHNYVDVDEKGSSIVFSKGEYSIEQLLRLIQVE